jgi:hypothetical protein
MECHILSHEVSHEDTIADDGIQDMEKGHRRTRSLRNNRHKRNSSYILVKQIDQ